MDKPSIKQVVIPTTIEQAVGALNGIDALLTAKGWERAAIVFAFTEERPAGNQPAQMANSRHLSISDFAALGIAGLTTRDTVRLYREAWIDGGGATNIGPGDTVNLPTGKFPPRDDTNFGARVSPTMAKNTVAGWSPEAKAEAVKALIADTTVTDVVIDELASQPDIVEKAEARIPRVTTPQVPVLPRTTDDWYQEIQDALHHMVIDIDLAIELMEEGIQNGWHVGDLEWAALAQTPSLTLKDSFAEFGKLVAMIQIDKARI